MLDVSVILDYLKFCGFMYLQIKDSDLVINLLCVYIVVGAGSAIKMWKSIGCWL